MTTQDAPAPAPTDEWLTSQEAAAYLRVGRRRLYEMIRDKRVRVGRVGTHLRFRRAWLDEAVITSDQA